jgi:hypothetical protein
MRSTVAGPGTRDANTACRGYLTKELEVNTTRDRSWMSSLVSLIVTAIAIFAVLLPGMLSHAH